MLPNEFKKIGFFMFLATYVFVVIQNLVIPSMSYNNAFPNIIEVIGFICLALIAFSKERIDDEFLNHLRIRIIVMVILLTFSYSLLDIFIFKIKHLYILEILQIQLLVYIILFHLFKRQWSIK